MTEPCNTHRDHEHSPLRGHRTVGRGDQIDYLHDCHLHHPHTINDVIHYDRQPLGGDAQHPDGCQTTTTSCQEASRVHGPGCGHPAITHGDHLN
jgi:hypothetical protein